MRDEGTQVTILPLFLSKVVQCYCSTCEDQQAPLVGNLMAKILKGTHCNQGTLTR